MYSIISLTFMHIDNSSSIIWLLICSFSSMSLVIFGMLLMIVLWSTMLLSKVSIFIPLWLIVWALLLCGTSVLLLGFLSASTIGLSASVVEITWFCNIYMLISILVTSAHFIAILVARYIDAVISSYTVWSTQLFQNILHLGSVFRFGKDISIAYLIVVKMLVFAYGSLANGGKVPQDTLLMVSVANTLHASVVTAASTRGSLLLITAASTAVVFTLSLVAASSRLVWSLLAQYLASSLVLLAHLSACPSLLDIALALSLLLAWSGCPLVAYALLKPVLLSLTLAWSSFLSLLIIILLLFSQARYILNILTFTAKWYIWLPNNQIDIDFLTESY